jgi:hypothetical protein
MPSLRIKEFYIMYHAKESKQIVKLIKSFDFSVFILKRVGILSVHEKYNVQGFKQKNRVDFHMDEGESYDV